MVLKPCTRVKTRNIIYILFIWGGVEVGVGVITFIAT